MSRHGRNHAAEPGVRVIPASLMGLMLTTLMAPAQAQVQEPAGEGPVPNPPAPVVVAEPPAIPAVEAPGVAPGQTVITDDGVGLPRGNAVVGPMVTPEGHGDEGPPALDPKVQVVRFSGPSGLNVEVLAPQAIPVPIGDGAGITTVGLERGVGYRLRLTNIAERPGAEVYPVIEVVGHLHRPAEIDPAKYPIRVIFTDDELWQVVDRGKLITKVIYLEDPEQAIPLKLPKDQIPVVTLNLTENPLKVAQALGRPIAIVRIGGRRPSNDEINAGATGDLGLDAMAAMGAGRCPYTSPAGDPCQLPCGPICTSPSVPITSSMPRDEYLCDGGDQGSPAGVTGDGSLVGIDPRDAVVRFDVGLNGNRKPRVLPTNRVCVYAPRFAEVHVSTGTNEAVEVHGIQVNHSLDRFAKAENRTLALRLNQNQAAEIARDRSRAQDMKSRAASGERSDARAAGGYNNVQHVKTDIKDQSPQIAKTRVQASQFKEKVQIDSFKTAESPVVKGRVEGLGQEVMSWQPNSMVGVETPPDRPGMAVIKRVNATEAEPGDKLTFVITYRNMGNTPIRDASVVDSLLPRLEYVKGSARGPKGTAFRADENRVGSTELEWKLPNVIPPGASGHVSFEAIVR